MIGVASQISSTQHCIPWEASDGVKWSGHQLVFTLSRSLYLASGTSWRSCCATLWVCRGRVASLCRSSLHDMPVTHDVVSLLLPSFRTAFAESTGTVKKRPVVEPPVEKRAHGAVHTHPRRAAARRAATSDIGAASALAAAQAPSERPAGASCRASMAVARAAHQPASQPAGRRQADAERRRPAADLATLL